MDMTFLCWLIITQNYIWTRELYNDTKSTSIIPAVMSIFWEFRTPEYLCSDGASNLTSQGMEELCKNFSIQHIVTSPYHPASNGKAESVVKTVKIFLNKTYHPHNFSIAMMTYHKTPLCVNLPTPAELMFGQWIHAVIPSQIVYEKEEEYVNFVQKCKH